MTERMPSASDASGERNPRVLAQQRPGLPSPVLYELIRLEGEEELERPTASLWWSGVGAGMAISMSVVMQAALQQGLPTSPSSHLISAFGYSLGFAIVVLGRLQLFTENTITAVLPVMASPTRRAVLRMLRLWVLVFAANLTGTAVFALAATYGGIFPPDLYQACLEVARHFMAKPAADMLLHGIPAGFLIAALVWMLPLASGSRFWVVLVMTYAIGVCDLSHVVVGSAEAVLVLLTGEIGPSEAIFRFLLPAFAGNVIGGTALFALLAYAQVREEL